MATCRTMWLLRTACRHYHFKVRLLKNTSLYPGLQKVHSIHTSPFLADETELPEKQLPSVAEKHMILCRSLFKDASTNSPDKESFMSAISTFEEFDKRRRGHIQFIETALVYMKHFKVEKDIECYNRILDIFPKGVFAPKNKWQAIFIHFPEQQMTGVKVLQHMEDNKIIPNKETRDILISVFGRTSAPVKKYQRMMYWFPKFRHINPFPLPEEIPNDPIKLAELGLKRMSEFEAEFKVFNLDNNSLFEETSSGFIAQVQSPDQKDLLSQHPPYRTLYIEGPFRLWLRDQKLGYFILRCDPLSAEKIEITNDEFYTAHKVEYPNHDMTESTVYAMCVTDRESRESLKTWVEKLQEDNPHLKRLNIVFNLFEPGTSAPEAANRYIEKGQEMISAE